MQLSLNADGFAGTTRLFDQMQRRGRSLYPVMRDIADDFLDLEREQFRTEGLRAEAWKPLATSTVRQRGQAHPILDDTGLLRDSLTVQGSRDQVRLLTANSALLGTDVAHAGYHQTGTGTMPQRRPIDVLPSDVDRWTGFIARYLVP